MFRFFGVSVWPQKSTATQSPETPPPETLKYGSTESLGHMVDSWRDLEVYKAAFELQQRVFRISSQWPQEERYSLIDQIRRSSRSVGANIAEAWAKRRYPNHFLSKLTDSDGELQETLHWLRTATDCGYIDNQKALELSELTTKIGKQLGAVMNKHESFCF